eukprot:g8613.t1 g8613   contig3:495248-497968(-)
MWKTMKGFKIVLLAVATSSSVSSESPSNNIFSQTSQEDDKSGITRSLCKSIIAIDGTRDPSYDMLYSSSNRRGRVVSGRGRGNAQQTVTDEEFVCELEDGSDLPIDATSEQLTELRELLNNGILISGESSVDVEGVPAVGDDANEQEAGKQTPTRPSRVGRGRVRLPAGRIVVNNNPRKRRSHNETRRLSYYEGKKPVLVVKVIDVDGRAVSDTADTISDKVFGTNGDTANMATQFESCSFKKLQITAKHSSKIEKQLSAPGVLEVDIPISLYNTQSDIRDAIRTAVEEKLEFQLPGPFHHVMYVIENCYQGCGWAAYAFVNGWVSVYRGINYKYPAVQLHEIGHNLNLAHSGGLNGETYTDHTCLMGNPLFSDTQGSMCFNAAKNYQIAVAEHSWYTDEPEHITSWDSGDKGGTSWSGRLIGVAEYDTNPNKLPIVLKLETGTDRDYFVGFNRAIGPNKDNKQADDEVTVIEAGNGFNYAQSFLRATLGQGDTSSHSKWRGTKLDLVVKVTEINTSVTPGYADITITFGAPLVPTTPQPSHAPTPPLPTQKPTTRAPVTSPPSMRPTTPRPITSSPSKRPTTFAPTRRPTSAPSPAPVRSSNSASSIIEYLLPNRKSPGTTKGIMFTIKAKNKDVTITGFDIASKRDVKSNVKVYTRTGDYEGNEKNASGWKKVFSSTQNLTTKNLSKLDMDAKQVTISAGETQSFYIYCKKGMLFARGDYKKLGNVFADDGVIEVSEGRASKRPFNNYKDYGQMMGVIRYRV